LSHTPHHTKSPLGSRGRDTLCDMSIWFLQREAMYKRGLYRHAVSVCVSVCHVRELCQN